MTKKVYRPIVPKILYDSLVHYLQFGNDFDVFPTARQLEAGSETIEIKISRFIRLLLAYENSSTVSGMAHKIARELFRSEEVKDFKILSISSDDLRKQKLFARTSFTTKKFRDSDFSIEEAYSEGNKKLAKALIIAMIWRGIPIKGYYDGRHYRKSFQELPTSIEYELKENFVRRRELRIFKPLYMALQNFRKFGSEEVFKEDPELEEALEVGISDLVRYEISAFGSNFTRDAQTIFSQMVSIDEELVSVSVRTSNPDLILADIPEVNFLLCKALVWDGVSIPHYYDGTEIFGRSLLSEIETVMLQEKLAEERLAR